MPRAPIPDYKKRQGTVRDAEVMLSIEKANGVFDPATGRYATITHYGCETRERAEEVQRELYRCKWHLNKKLNPKIGISCKIVKQKDGTYNVDFFAVNLDHARAYVPKTYGSDKSKWAY